MKSVTALLKATICSWLSVGAGVAGLAAGGIAGAGAAGAVSWAAAGKAAERKMVVREALYIVLLRVGP